MPAPGKSDDEVLALLRDIRDYGGCVQASRVTGKTAKIYDHAKALAKQRGLSLDRDHGDYTTPFIEDHAEDPSIRWERRRKAFRKRREYEEARSWMPFRMKRNEPCAVLWFGDPHLDDDGCDFDALEAAIEVANLPGVYSVGIGDYTNCWVGRLARLYAKQETTASQAWKDVAYFVRERGINWLTLIKGNHDLWAGSGDPLDYIAKGVSDLHAWRAQFKLTFPNGFELPVDAAHDHKGHSQYSDSFGAKKAAYFDGRASLYVCGHKHSASLDRFVHPHRGTKHEAFRVRGFKYFDDYALVNGFSEQRGAEAMLTVIDPRDGYFQTFDDIRRGVQMLEAIR